MKRLIHVEAVAALLFALSVTGAAAQEFRGTLTGRVTDTTGGIMPGVSVTVVNLATGAAATTTTNTAGDYTAPYLTPGGYSITFELIGFRKVARSVEVRVGDRVEVDAVLEPGAVSETVQVTAETPLLDTTSGSTGQVIDERRIALLPLADGNPFVLARFAPGITYTGDLKFSRPFDNSGTSAIVADGAPGSNEFTIDGSPNEANGKRIAYVPPSDLVQEFRVESASYDAQQGHTAGASVNVVMKSGTNELKGTIYGFLRNTQLSANDFFLNRTGTPNPGNDYKHWGGTAGGPITRNRTFFFVAFERLTDSFPEPGQFTVPTLAERKGDFSALLAQNIVIYDPLTARRQGSVIVRQPFASNVIPPERLNSVALNYLKYYPLPNQAGDAQGHNNFFSPQPRTDTFYTESYRVDHELSDRRKIFARYYRNHRLEDRGNWTGVVNGVKPTGNFLYRINDGIAADHLYTISARTLLDLRGGWSRFQEINVRESDGAFDPASLGFSAQSSSLFSGSYLPRFDIGNMSLLGNSLGDTTSLNIYSFQPTLTRLVGSHSLRLGYDFRVYREYNLSAGNPAGAYTFRTDYTRQSSSGTGAAIGQDLAAFLLGVPNNGGGIDVNSDRLNSAPYNAGFIQDDWKATSRLTVNLGLRYEYEGPTRERLNRNLRGFDTTSPNPIEAAAVAAYTANPIPELQPSDFHVKGGSTYATSSDPAFWKADKTNIEPRAGFAFTLNRSTVMRGGFGIYAVPFVIDGVHLGDFSRTTPVISTLDTGLTFVTDLGNPFIYGKLSPTGSSLGLTSLVGRSVTFVPIDRKQARAARWSVGIERQLPGAWVVEASYVGNHGYHLATTQELDSTPARFQSTSPMRDQSLITFLDANVPNPFQNLIPGLQTLGLSSVTSRRQLLRPFPEFTGITSQAYDGTSQFHSAQLRVERRFHGGYTLLASYTWSRLMGRTSKLNATDTQYERRLSGEDVPHRLTASGIWELPFGKGHAHAGGRLANALAGGWSLQVLGQAQSGRPITLGNLYFGGDPNQLRANISSATLDGAFDISGFYFHDAAVQRNGVDDPVRQRGDNRIRLADNIRALPTRFDNFRGQALSLWDLSAIKRLQLTDRLRMQLNVELLNAFNRPQFADPNLDPTKASFGTVTSQSNLPRNIQLAAKLLF